MHTFFDSTLRPAPNDAGNYVSQKKIPIARWVESICFMPNGDLATGGRNIGYISFWDTETGIRKKGILPKFSDKVNCLTPFPETGKIVFSEGNRISIWDYQGSDKESTSWIAHNSLVTCLAVSPEGEIASSSYCEKEIYIWDMLGSKKRILSGHEEGIFELEYLATGDLASSSYDATIRIWDKDTTRCKLILKTSPGSLIKSLPNGNLVSLSRDGQVDIFDTKNGECLMSKSSAVAHVSWMSMAITATGDVVLPDNNNVTIMDCDGNYKEKLPLSKNETKNEKAKIVFVSPEGIIGCTTTEDFMRTWKPIPPQLQFNP